MRPAGVSCLEVPVDDKAVMHVLQAQDDLGGIETHLLLAEDSVLGQVVVQVATCPVGVEGAEGVEHGRSRSGR